MHRPSVSVILPVYNGERYLSAAIQSVLSQTLNDFELIVVDDGSTDSSATIAQSFGDRVKYVRQENRGVAAAFNHGLRVANGRYISWLSHDDELVCDKLRLQVEALKDIAQPAVCYSDAVFIGTDGEVIRELKIRDPGPSELVRALFVSEQIVMAAYSLLYDRRCIDEVGWYDENQSDTQDADMLIRMARKFPFVHVPQPLIRIREHPGRDSHNPRWTREALKFYARWSDEIALEELSPELKIKSSAVARARTRVSLGDSYLLREIPPFRKLAMRQYGLAIRESPLIIPLVMGRVTRFLAGPAWRFYNNHRHFYRYGLRSALSRRLKN